MKTVMITDTVYAGLSKVKGDKSFSELLGELLESTKETKPYKVALLNTIAGTITREEADEAEAIIKKLKENARVRR